LTYFGEVSGFPVKSLVARRAGFKQQGTRLLQRYVKLKQELEVRVWIRRGQTITVAVVALPVA
jgi:hypothetical protein